ncbi:hypothetical protein [Actinomadura bangladeshensis]|uniref:hypothetical protein n=1 Tax=Actinomadura bangladeshensis TaxID=453573 RepID=UPI001FB66BB8|nr:hypothetical protein [Actinomadura bangladeshensis]
MSHRQVLEALSGLLLVLFVAMLSSTVALTVPLSIGVPIAVVAIGLLQKTVNSSAGDDRVGLLDRLHRFALLAHGWPPCRSRIHRTCGAGPLTEPHAGMSQRHPFDQRHLNRVPGKPVCVFQAHGRISGGY